MISKTQKFLLTSKYQTDDISKVIDMVDATGLELQPFQFVYRKNNFKQLGPEEMKKFELFCHRALIINYFKQIPSDIPQWFCFHRDPITAYYDSVTYFESNSYREDGPNLEEKLSFSIQSLQLALAMMKGVIDSDLLKDVRSFVEYYELGCRLLKDVV
jgi:hypothetical protein